MKHSVKNIKKLPPTSSHQHHDATKITVTKVVFLKTKKWLVNFTKHLLSLRHRKRLPQLRLFTPKKILNLIAYLRTPNCYDFVAPPDKKIKF